jgi:hypothetical protein
MGPPVSTDTNVWASLHAEHNGFWGVHEKEDNWFDRSVHIVVRYRDGKAVFKDMIIRQPGRSKVWGWLDKARKFIIKRYPNSPGKVYGLAVAAGVISLWAMFVILAVMGLSFTTTGRIRVTKTSALSGRVATTLGIVIFLLGLLMAIATWPPFLLHSIPWQ